MQPEVLILEGVTLGTRAKIARILRRWRQSDLAAVADVPAPCVSQLERDVACYPAARKRILDALDIEDPYPRARSA